MPHIVTQSEKDKWIAHAHEIEPVKRYKLHRLYRALARARYARDKARRELREARLTLNLFGNLGHLGVRRMLDDYGEANNKLRKQVIELQAPKVSLLERVRGWFSRQWD